MKRATILPLLTGLALLSACGGGSSAADKTAFAMLDANQAACDSLVDGVIAAFQQGASAAATPAAAPAAADAPNPPTPQEAAAHAYLKGPGAAAAAEMEAGLPFADKAIRPVAGEQTETRNLLVDWQERQSHICAAAANPTTLDDLKVLASERERVQKAIRDDRAKLTSSPNLSPSDLTSLTKDRAQTVRIAVKEKLGEMAAETQLAQQRESRVEAEAAEAHQLVLDDQAREEEKTRLKVQEEEDKEALVVERRAAEELEIKMKRERQDKTMRERQIQGAAVANQQLHSWAQTYRQQIEPFAKTVRTAQHLAAGDPSVCPFLHHAGDGVRIPSAPDPNLQEHLSEALRLVSAAAESCGQKLRDTTAFRLQLVMEHLAAIDRELPSGP
jgi:hypothetical protein